MAFKRLLKYIDSDFQDILSWRSREVERLFSLPDRFLGRALRDIGRAARSELGHPFDYPDHTGYGAGTLWNVIPGLARALGETDLTSDERFGACLLPENLAHMRRFTGLCLGNSEIPYQVMRSDKRSVMLNAFLVSGEFVNGNPIAIALDRVSPPKPQSNDWIAIHMREISSIRFGHSDFDRWTPEFNAYPRRNIFFGEAVEEAMRELEDEVREPSGPEM